MIVFDRDRLERRELIDAGVVHEHVNLAERGDRFGDEPGNIRRFGDAGLDRDGLAAEVGDLLHDTIRALAAGSVVDDDRRAFGGEMAGDGSADALGGAGDDGNFTREGLTGGGIHDGMGLVFDSVEWNERKIQERSSAVSAETSSTRAMRMKLTVSMAKGVRYLWIQPTWWAPASHRRAP